MQLGRNDPCRCGSGKKYKKCHLDEDREAERAFIEALPALREIQQKIERVPERLRREYSVYINLVAPVQFQGATVWAIGSRVYPNRPPNETFHEFLISVMRETFSEDWRREQTGLPEGQQHFVLKASNEYAKWKAANFDEERLAREGRMSAPTNGWVQYLINLAWDVATLIQATNLPDSLVKRLRDPGEFQGARYELAIAAIFARLDCVIDFLNEDEALRTQTHAEFIATHRPSGQQVAVEAKSRRRPGVINEDGEMNEADPLKRDVRSVQRLFKQALEQRPSDVPFVIFIDINAPLEPDVEALEKQWVKDIKSWMGRMPTPTAESPDEYSALYVTNFSPHYDAADLARGSEWLAVKPFYARHPMTFDITGMLDRAVDTYFAVPELEADGMLAD